MDNLDTNMLSDFDPDSNYYTHDISQNHIFSNYDSIDDFLKINSQSINDKNFITIFGQNIRSFNRNLDNFLCLFPENSMPDVFIFSETWHDANIPVIIPGYTAYHTVRTDRRSGGVSVYAKQCFKSCQILELSYANNTIEICTIKISNAINHFYICGIYRPHSDTIDNFCSTLESILNNNQILNDNCLFAGDFNADLFSGSGEINRLVNMMRSFHYLQLITDCTHPGINLSASTLIDLIWINKLYTYNCGIIKTGITDHHAIFVQVPFLTHKENSDKIKITFRDCCVENERKFENKLSSLNWDSLKSDDLDVYVSNFISKLNKVYQDSFPIKTKFVTINYFKNPWHTKDVNKLTLARNKYHELLLLNLITHAEYSRFRNKVTSLLRKCKEKYFNACFSRNAGNIKATWKIIRKICNGHQKKSIDKIILNDTTYENSSDLAEIFNNFFVNIAHDLAENLPASADCPYAYVNRNTHDCIILDPVTPDEISNIIFHLKITKQDTNIISVKLFKKYHRYFLRTVCDMINICLQSGIFPTCFKHATVIPIFKKGDPCSVYNYRPIALLPFISKIFERCIFSRLSNYATTCNLLTPNQFGFTRGRSTQDAILLLTEKIYECFNNGNGNFCINIFIDFQKCFDTIDHDILINKLRLYGIDGSALCLLKNYLSNRTQSVRIHDTLSSTRPINVGVPQGSILGPLLFLFFINDLPNISNAFTSILFADDTTLSFNCSSIEQSNELCNTELNKFFLWALSNKLSINFGQHKSYFIVHTYRRTLNTDDLHISLNGNILQNMDEGLFLGVTIDNKLKYQTHINNICAKIAKSIGIIYNLKKLKVPLSVLKQVYYSLVYPYLNYNVCSYAGTYPTYLNRILLLQKRLVRIISNAPFLAHTDRLFQENKILKITDIYNLNIGLYMYDHRQTGLYVRTHTYNTRNRSDLIPNRPRLNITRNSISVAGPNIWNSIPLSIKNAPSRSSFKHQYKNLLLSAYTSNSP